MDETEFMLDARFRVRPTTNFVTDTVLQTDVRLEPRLMKLLCILYGEANQMVTRERLVKEVWDDYGGGEEGLTHAVSSLRKLFNDASKTLIRTVPKKGYILHVEIAQADQDREPISKENKTGRKAILYASTALLAVLALFTIVYCSRTEQKRSSAFNARTNELSVPFNEVSQTSVETRYNTIVTVGVDSIRYKLIIHGDSRPEFYINDQLLSPDEMEKHANLIQNMKAQLLKRNGD